MMVLGVSGLANIPFAALLSMLIPPLIGMPGAIWTNALNSYALAAQPAIIIMSRSPSAPTQYQYGVHRRAVRDPVGDYLRANRDCVLLYLQPVFEEEKRAGRRANHRQLGADAGDGCLCGSFAGDVRGMPPPRSWRRRKAITMITAPILVAWLDKRLKKRASR